MPSGYNGSGQFQVPYIFVNDAAAGIKILAARQDAQWNAMISGFNIAMCRDGQAVWTGAQNAGGFGITNLASAGGVVGNAANYGDIIQNTSQWTPEITSVSFNSTTAFNVLGVNKTSTYIPGRRVQITHNTGATTSYATIVSSTFGTNTVVTVSVDGGVALVSTLTVVLFSIMTPNNTALPGFSCINEAASAFLVAMTSGASLTLGGASLAGTVVNDRLGEVSSGIFTAIYPGEYYFSAMLDVSGSGATYTIPPTLALASTGTPAVQALQASVVNANNHIGVAFGLLFKLAAGNTLQAGVVATFTGTSFVQNWNWSIMRVQ